MSNNNAKKLRKKNKKNNDSDIESVVCMSINTCAIKLTHCSTN